MCPFCIILESSLQNIKHYQHTHYEQSSGKKYQSKLIICRKHIRALTMAFPEGSGTIGLRFIGAAPPKWLGPKPGTENTELVSHYPYKTLLSQHGPTGTLQGQSGNTCQGIRWLSWMCLTKNKKKTPFKSSLLMLGRSISQTNNLQTP